MFLWRLCTLCSPSCFQVGGVCACPCLSRPFCFRLGVFPVCYFGVCFKLSRVTSVLCLFGLSLVFSPPFLRYGEFTGRKSSFTLDFGSLVPGVVPTSGCVYTSRINFIPWFNFILGSLLLPVRFNSFVGKFLFLFRPSLSWIYFSFFFFWILHQFPFVSTPPP